MLLRILLKARYFRIAWLLEDLLEIKFRDEYALSFILGAGFLDIPRTSTGATGDSDADIDSSSDSDDAMELGYPDEPAQSTQSNFQPIYSESATYVRPSSPTNVPLVASESVVERSVPVDSVLFSNDNVAH